MIRKGHQPCKKSLANRRPGLRKKGAPTGIPKAKVQRVVGGLERHDGSFLWAGSHDKNDSTHILIGVIKETSTDLRKGSKGQSGGACPSKKSQMAVSHVCKVV